MPFGAQILAVNTQFEEPKMWAIVDTDKQKAFRKIIVIGTGNPIHPQATGTYIGSYQLSGGNLIFHVFDDGYEY